MNWLSGLHIANNCKFQTRLLSRVLGIIALSCSGLTMAEPLEQAMDSNDMAWMNHQTGTLADSDLSLVIGKGADGLALDADAKLAILLWDERGNDNRRGMNHDVNSSASVNLTVVHR